MAAGGSVGACGGGDALPTRPVQVHICVGVTRYVVHVVRLLRFFFLMFWACFTYRRKRDITVAVSLKVGTCGLAGLCEIDLASCFLFLSSQLACSFVMSIFGPVLEFRCCQCHCLCWGPRNVKVCQKPVQFSPDPPLHTWFQPVWKV